MKKLWELKFQVIAAVLLVAGIMSRAEGAAAMEDLMRSLGPVVLGGVGVFFAFRGVKKKAAGLMEHALQEAQKQGRTIPGQTVPGAKGSNR